MSKGCQLHQGISDSRMDINQVILALLRLRSVGFAALLAAAVRSYHPDTAAVAAEYSVGKIGRLILVVGCARLPVLRGAGGPQGLAAPAAVTAPCRQAAMTGRATLLGKFLSTVWTLHGRSLLVFSRARRRIHLPLAEGMPGGWKNSRALL
jgi:hypothetical protein